MAHVVLNGYCPACGQEKLGASANDIRCMNPQCERPTAAAELLAAPPLQIEKKDH